MRSFLSPPSKPAPAPPSMKFPPIEASPRSSSPRSLPSPSISTTPQLVRSRSQSTLASVEFYPFTSHEVLASLSPSERTDYIKMLLPKGLGVKAIKDEASAQKNGLKRCDVITAINGVSIAESTAEEAIDLLKDNGLIQLEIIRQEQVGTVYGSSKDFGLLTQVSMHSLTTIDGKAVADPCAALEGTRLVIEADMNGLSKLPVPFWPPSKHRSTLPLLLFTRSTLHVHVMKDGVTLAMASQSLSTGKPNEILSFGLSVPGLGVMLLSLQIQVIGRESPHCVDILGLDVNDVHKDHLEASFITMVQTEQMRLDAVEVKYMAMEDVVGMGPADRTALLQYLQSLAINWGFPMSHRTWLWEVLSILHSECEGWMKMDSMQHQRLPMNVSYLKKDAGRVQVHGSQHPLWRGDGGPELRLVLLEVSQAGYGYCQGMNIIAAWLLLLMDSHHTASFLKRLIYQFFRNYHSRSMVGATVDRILINELLKCFDEDLFNHLQDTGIIPGDICFQWLMLGFLDVAPSITVLRIWDLFMAVGRKVLIGITVAAILSCSDKLMQSEDPEEIRDLIMASIGNCYDPTALILRATNIIQSANADAVFAMEDEYERNIMTNVQSSGDQQLRAILQQNLPKATASLDPVINDKKIIQLQEAFMKAAGDIKDSVHEYALTLDQFATLLSETNVLPEVSVGGSSVEVDAFVAALFNYFDSEGDGVVDLRELCAGLAFAMESPMDTRFELAFKAFDSDKSGGLSREEFRHALRVMRGGGEGVFAFHFISMQSAVRFIDWCFDNAKKNDNGEIGLSEFKLICQSDALASRFFRSHRLEHKRPTTLSTSRSSFALQAPLSDEIRRPFATRTKSFSVSQVFTP